MSFALWRDRILLVLIALLPWQARYLKESASLFGLPWEQGNASLYALEILLALALVCHLLAVATRCEPRKAGSPLWLDLAALIPLYAFITVFWAYDTTGALFTLIHLCEGYIFAYLIWNSGLTLARGLSAFVLGTAASCALGLWQYLTQTSFASSWLGVAAHAPQDPGVAVVETAGGRFLRAYGSLPHPNILGGYAAAGLTAAIALTAQARRARPALYAAVFLLAAGLIATFSRSAWIAAAAALIALLFFPRATSSKETRKALAPALIAALAGIAFVAAFSAPLLFARLSAHGRLEAKSIAERESSLSDGMEMTLRYFATGVGIGNYMPTAFLSLGVPDDPSTVQPPHFVPLLVGAELGFFGLALLIGFVFVWWFSAVWLLRRSTSPIIAAAAILPLVVIAVSCFDHYAFDLLTGTLLTGTLFGFFLKAGEESVD